jgi:DNA (cytosine-5)-methyltransferase 1
VKLFSLFTGIGGLDYGLKNRTELVGYSEIKESSIKIFEKYHKGKNYGDITKLDLDKLPDFDILTGGFPCQSFSLAGLRKGFDDFKGNKGQMIFYIHRLILKKKPKYVVLENVKGLLTHNKGKTFRDVFKLLQSAGYYVRVVLLNALYYGSAENRERIIFICSLKDFEAKKPVIKDQRKRFRDFIDRDSVYKYYTDIPRNIEKLEQKRDFNYELIGGYDRVGTLTTNFGCGEKAVWEPKKQWYRYLTPLECERLQGFPDGYTEGVSNADRYWALGNAVNCNMSDYLFNDYLEGLWW